MEHAIGEIITLPDGRKAKVVKSDTGRDCDGCFFKDKDCLASDGWCKKIGFYLLEV